MNDASLREMERMAQEDALKEISEIFQRSENLEKLDDTRDRFEKIQQSTESQLKSAMHSQLDGVRNGLNKLDSALKEATLIHERISEISINLKKISGLSSELVDLREKCEHYHNLDATMNHMKQIALIPQRMREAQKFIENSSLLQAHQILQELEGIRNEIMLDIYRYDQHSTNLTIVEEFFREDIDNLNAALYGPLMSLASRLLSATITNSKLLVTSIRIIDREERADALWFERNETHGFLPPKRPKEWKKKFFDKFSECIGERIYGSAVDKESDKNYLTRHLENIRLICVNDLAIAKNICPPFFPPDYEIFQRLFVIYHLTLGKFVEETVHEISQKNEYIIFLGWMNSIWTDNFLGQFAIDFSKIKLEYPLELMNENDLNQLRSKYVSIVRNEYRNYIQNILEKAKSDWLKSEEPSLDGSSFYWTILSSFLLSYVSEMVVSNPPGTPSILNYVGLKVKEETFQKFSEELISFGEKYKEEITNYRNAYNKDRNSIPKYMAYLLANVNDCDRITQIFVDIVQKELEKEINILPRFVGVLDQVKKSFENVRELCLKYAVEMIINDTEEALKKFMTKEWLLADNYFVASEVIAQMDYYRTCAIAHLRPPHDVTITAKVAYQLCLRLLVGMFQQKLVVSSERERDRLSERLNDEARQISTYLEELELPKELLKPVEAIQCVSQIISNDKSMLSLYILNMLGNFKDMRREQLQIILNMRGDMRSAEAKDIAIDYIGENPTINPNSLQLFTEVANYMKQNNKGLLL